MYRRNLKRAIKRAIKRVIKRAVKGLTTSLGKHSNKKGHLNNLVAFLN